MSSPINLGGYEYTKTEASSVCAAKGKKLCEKRELLKSDFCSCGWTEDLSTPGYPMANGDKTGKGWCGGDNGGQVWRDCGNTDWTNSDGTVFNGRPGQRPDGNRHASTFCCDSATGNISDIVTNIANLQKTEQELINELDSYTSKSGGYVATDPIIIGLVTKINAIADSRIAMLKTISTNANILQTGVSQSRVDLVSQMTLLQVVEDQLNAAKEKIQQLNNKNDTQMRLVEINTYYGQRYEAQGSLMQKIIMVCIPLLILFILKKKGILPEMIANYVIGIVIALGTIYILYNVWDIFVRSNMDFNTYDWAYEQPDGQVPSIWEYNKKNMFNFDGILKNLMANLGVCIGEQCCAPGLTYDNTRMQCVKPPLAQKTVSTFTTMGNLQGTVLRNTDALNDEIIGVAPFTHDMAFASVA